MTTKAAAQFYMAQHNLEMEGKRLAVFNPNSEDIDKLPTIYGFNNGGQGDWWNGQLFAEDGTALGQHVCSHECYMLHDLGILEGTRPDRHEGFKEHYPNGYKMTFVSLQNVKKHEGIQKAYKLNQEKRGL